MSWYGRLVCGYGRLISGCGRLVSTDSSRFRDGVSLAFNLRYGTKALGVFRSAEGKCNSEEGGGEGSSDVLLSHEKLLKGFGVELRLFEKTGSFGCIVSFMAVDGI